MLRANCIRWTSKTASQPNLADILEPVRRYFANNKEAKDCLETVRQGKNYKVKALSTHLKEKLEKIEQIIAKLTEESAKGKPIVVEGKKDAQALQELGVNGAIVTVKTGGKSFLEATAEIENLGASEVILVVGF